MLVCHNVVAADLNDHNHVTQSRVFRPLPDSPWALAPVIAIPLLLKLIHQEESFFCFDISVS